MLTPGPRHPGGGTSAPGHLGPSRPRHMKENTLKYKTRTATAVALSAALLFSTSGPAAAGWWDWTPRQGWCAVWPSFCR